MSANVNINAIVEKVKNILMGPIKDPKKMFDSIKAESQTMQDLVIYLAIIGVPMLICIIIGYGVVGIGGWGYHFRISFGWAFAWGISQYVFSIVGIVIFGYILNALAPSFSSKQNRIQAMKLVACTATPWFIAGILYIFPPLSILVFLAGLYGLYILYLGLPVLMETPEDKRIIYLIVSIVVYIIIMVVVSQVTGAIMGRAVGYHHYIGW
jgi:Yip1 domain.